MVGSCGKSQKIEWCLYRHVCSCHRPNRMKDHQGKCIIMFRGALDEDTVRSHSKSRLAKQLFQLVMGKEILCSDFDGVFFFI